MISPSDAAHRQPSPGELLSDRGGQSVADLLVRAGVSRGISEMLYPDLAQESRAAEAKSDEECAELKAEVETLSLSEMECGLRLAAAREEAYHTARSDFEVELTTKLVEERRRVDRMRVEFARDRQKFFAAAESQVVRLALAVASRVLSREVATEGLPLRATVKAALGRVQETSVTSLRVPPEEADAWKDLFQRSSAGKVKVEPDERLSHGECVLETTVGTVEMGIDVQMEEIARGFSGLLQEHDGETKVSAVGDHQAEDTEAW